MSQSNHTLESIAKMAGVSRSTVSRVINNKENVSDNARKKVLEIIKQVNYYPNASARSLASKKTNNIGVVFWGNNPLFLSPERIYSEIMQGIQKKVIELNLDLMLYTSKNVDENFCYKIIGQKAVDGLIIM
ncbi:MAG: LacI family DNA-binding transcriptional regulator, partial [bacterium]